MSKIYQADSQDYIVAPDFDTATEKYIEVRGKDPQTLSLFAEESVVVNASETQDIELLVLPTLAEDDGALTSPSGNVYLQAGDKVTLTAIPSVGYPTFVNWTDESDVEISTDNPFTYTAVAGASQIKANFSV